MSSQNSSQYHNLSIASSYFDSSTPSSALLPDHQNDEPPSSSSSLSSSSSPPASPPPTRCCRRWCFRGAWLVVNVLMLILSVVLVVVDHNKLLRSAVFHSLHLASQDRRVPRAILIVGMVSIVFACFGIILSIRKRLWLPPAAPSPAAAAASYAAAPSPPTPARSLRFLRVYLVVMLLGAIVLVVLGAIMLSSARKSYISDQLTQAWGSASNSNRVSLQQQYNCCGLTAFNDTYAGSPCPASTTFTCLPALQREVRRQRRVTGGLAIGVSKLMFVSVLMWIIRRCLQRRAARREAAARAAAVVSSPSNFYLPTAAPV